MENQYETPQPSQPARRGIPLPTVQPRLTFLLIGIIVLVHIYVNTLNAIDNNQFYFDYSQLTEAVVDGEYYRLITSMFLHQGLLHLGFNCFALYIYGRLLESLLGYVRFALVYFLGGIIGGVFTLATTSNVLAFGASGAVFAVLGAMAAHFLRNRKIYGEDGKRLLRDLAILAAINLFIGFGYNAASTTTQIGNAAHIGGAVGGFILAWFVTPVFAVRMAVSENGVHQYVVDESSFRQEALVTGLYSIVTVAAIAFIVGAKS